MDTPGPGGGNGVMVAQELVAVPATLSIVGVLQTTMFPPLVTKPESAKLVIWTMAGSNCMKMS